MSKNSESIINELEERKKALRDELRKLESGIESGVSGIQQDVTRNLDPKTWVRRHPLKVFGAAILIGFMAGNRSGSENRPSTATRITVAGSIIAALKSYAARRAVDQIVNIIEGRKAEK